MHRRLSRFSEMETKLHRKQKWRLCARTALELLPMISRVLKTSYAKWTVSIAAIRFGSKSSSRQIECLHRLSPGRQRFFVGTGFVHAQQLNTTRRSSTDAHD